MLSSKLRGKTDRGGKGGKIPLLVQRYVEPQDVFKPGCKERAWLGIIYKTKIASSTNNFKLAVNYVEIIESLNGVREETFVCMLARCFGLRMLLHFHSSGGYKCAHNDSNSDPSTSLESLNMKSGKRAKIGPGQDPGGADVRVSHVDDPVNILRNSRTNQARCRYPQLWKTSSCSFCLSER